MNYEDFCHIASVCTEQIGPKCRRFFSPSNFMKFEKDEQGRIAILPFYLYVMRTVCHLPTSPILVALLFNSPEYWSIYVALCFISSLKLFFFAVWLYLELDDSSKCSWKVPNDYGCAGFTYSGKNWYEWAWWGFWWFPSATCMDSYFYYAIF